MGKPSPHVVIAFHTTAEALGFRKLAEARGLAGRLAPIPRQISAGCGFAWREPAANRQALSDLIDQEQVEYESMTVLDL